MKVGLRIKAETVWLPNRRRGSLAPLSNFADHAVEVARHSDLGGISLRAKHSNGPDQAPAY
jgi:hypothetical protein